MLDEIDGAAKCTTGVPGRTVFLGKQLTKNFLLPRFNGGSSLVAQIDCSKV